MTDSNMPATEAAVENERELNAYELAFHILPTVAEGEVQTIFDSVKAAVVTAGGTVTNEELPARFDLAYEIVQYLEGRNRKFKSAHFGWVRFDLEADKVAEVVEMVEGTKDIMRHLLIRLTKVEAANPFFFHPAIADRVVETIIIEADEAEVVATEEVEGEVEVKAEDGEVAAEAV
jgi:ribosomal protein S6